MEYKVVDVVVAGKCKDGFLGLTPEFGNDWEIFSRTICSL